MNGKRIGLTEERASTLASEINGPSYLSIGNVPTARLCSQLLMEMSHNIHVSLLSVISTHLRQRRVRNNATHFIFAILMFYTLRIVLRGYACTNDVYE